MSTDDRPGGPIDPWSKYSLHDVIDPDTPMDPRHGDGFEYEGFHIVPQTNGSFHVQYDGHAGSVMSFHQDDYDDVLELVADLNDLVHRAFEYDYQDDKETLVEWAGKIMTSDPERAEENSELYIHVPDDVPDV